MLNIASGGVFVASQPALNERPSGDATCADAGSRVSGTSGRAAPGGNLPVNVLLRERPEDQINGVVESYLLNSRGELQPIPDGGTYLCLTYADPVARAVPDSAADA